MKLAFIYDVIYPYIKGGAERRYYEIARRLARRHEVHLYGMKFWEGPGVKCTEEGLYLHGVCLPKTLYIDGRRSIGQALYYSSHLLPALLKDDFDLVDCCSVPYFPIYSAKLYALIKHRPLVITWLEFWGDYWFQYLGRVKGVLGRGVEHLATTLPDKILAISCHTMNSLVRAGVPKDKIVVIPCGTSWRDLQEVVARQERSDLIFVGRLIREKNVDLLIQVIALLSKRYPAITCFIIGDGPERSALEALAGKMGVAGNIRFWGKLETADMVYSLMKSSRIFVTLSEREGFNIVALEASACNLPVVIMRSAHNAATDWIIDGQNGCVCEPSAEGVAEKIAQLLDDSSLYVAIAQNAWDCSKAFDWDVIAQNVEQFYLEVIRSRGR